MPKKPSRLPYVQRLTLKGGGYSYRGWTKVHGRRVFSPCYPTERAAYEAALRMAKQASAPIADGVTLDQACATVLEELRAKRTEGSQRWYSGHFDAVRKLIPGDTPLHRITPATVEQFIRDRLADWAKRPVLDKDGNVITPGRHVKPATVNADLRALHRVFAIAIRRGHADTNPVRQVDRPRADAVAMAWFTEDEFRELLAKVTDQAAFDLFALLAMTGVRRSEAARLTVDHVRLANGQLVVPGKNSTRVVPIGPDLQVPLRRMLSRATAGGELIPDGLRAIDQAFRDWKKTLGDSRWHPHALRHTFGTALIRHGVRPDVVMRLMGHRSINTTLRYVHEVGGDGAAAVHRLAVLPLLARDQEAEG